MVQVKEREDECEDECGVMIGTDRSGVKGDGRGLSLMRS